jgi:hypothetical protein
MHIPDRQIDSLGDILYGLTRRNQNCGRRGQMKLATKRKRPLRALYAALTRVPQRRTLAALWQSDCSLNKSVNSPDGSGSSFNIYKPLCNQ